MTPEILSACTGARIDRARTHAPFITQAMVEFEINTPARQAAFLAQVGHESGGLHWMEELWGAAPTAQQARYERDFSEPWPASPKDADLTAFARNRLAYHLGNTERGDGARFKGHGWIQITGRANHLKCGIALGMDLVSRPEQLGTPGPAARSAGSFWKTHGLNELADDTSEEQFIVITERINGARNGLADRLRLWGGSKIALNVS